MVDGLAQPTLGQPVAVAVAEEDSPTVKFLDLLFQLLSALL